MPSYYSSFSCKCGQCRHVCCRGWNIPLSRDEYFRLLGMECSHTLRRTLDTAFFICEKPTPERYALMSPSALDGSCRMLGADGYCRLQRERGEEAITAVCRLYPRSVKNTGHGYEAVCSASCEKTVEMFCSLDSPVSFREEKTALFDAPPVFPRLSDADEGIRRSAAGVILGSGSLPSRLRRIGKISGFILPPRRRSAKTAAAALRILTELVASLSAGSEAASGTGEDALSALGLSAPSGDTYAGALKYLSCLSAASSAIPHLELDFSNLIANHMFYERYPYADGSNDAADSFPALCAAYGLLKLFCIPLCAGSAEPQKVLTDSAAAAFRLIEHTSFYNTVLLLMRRDGETDPASLAALCAM